MATGANVNTSWSLVLTGETIKIKIPMKNAATIFLYDECKIKGRCDKVPNSKTVNNTPIVTYTDKATCW